MRRGFAPILIIVPIVSVLGIVAMFLYFQLKPKSAPQPQPTVIQSTPTDLSSDLSAKDSSSVETQVLEDETANWKTYTSQEGKYSVKYPDSVKIYVNEKMSVDGVKVPVKDTIALVSDELPHLKTNYQLSINHKIASEANLKDFVDKNSLCAEIQSGKAKTFILNGQQASIFENTPCGPYGMTAIYVLHNGVGYIIEIETQASYSAISKFTDQILSTFQFID